MKFLIASIIIGPLVLVGASPAVAGQSSALLGSGAPIRLAASDVSKADRDTYIRKAQNEMLEWQRRLHNFSEKMTAKGKRVGDAAGHDLNKAWTKADAASHELESVGAEGWKSAKISFESATRELAHTWDKTQSKGK
jgi:hypothetical protein